MKNRNHKKIENILDYLLIPARWFDNRLKKFFIIFIILFCSTGAVLCQYYSFPYFEFYVFILGCIGLIALESIKYYNKKMPQITTSLTIVGRLQSANIFYYKYVYKNIIYLILPIAIAIIFGYGGCLMFDSLSVDILFIWIMFLFSVVVYLSIVGYVQYIFLAIYIYKITISKAKLLNFQHSLNECIPADLEWIQSLTKLSHVYRTSFFTIGCMYIIAFGLFCHLPEFNANCNSLIYYALWGIILIAIVIAFPIISILEHYWIKKIVKKTKDTYISDLKKESNYLKKTCKDAKIGNTQSFLLENIYAFRIMESRDYPIISIWNMGYNVLLAIFNFLATVITVFQGIPMISNGFHQIP